MRLLISSLVIWTSLAQAGVIWEGMPPERYSFSKLSNDEEFQKAQSYLFAFDHGHALLYSRLLQIKESKKKYSKEQLLALDKELVIDIQKLLNRHFATKSFEEDIAPHYSRLFSKTVNVFDWSHYLHQFLYDVMATHTEPKQMIERAEAIFTEYKKQYPLYVITDKCLSMTMMDDLKFIPQIDTSDKYLKTEGVTFSKTFSETFPFMNDLIWTYHWFQMALYDALIAESKEMKVTQVKSVVKEFEKKVQNLPRRLNFAIGMPVMKSSARKFTYYKGSEKDPLLFARIAVVFDNLHLLHDILSDLLSAEEVPDGDELIHQGRFFTHNLILNPMQHYFSSNCPLEELKPRLKEKK